MCNRVYIFSIYGKIKEVYLGIMNTRDLPMFVLKNDTETLLEN